MSAKFHLLEIMLLLKSFELSAVFELPGISAAWKDHLLSFQ